MSPYRAAEMSKTKYCTKDYEATLRSQLVSWMRYTSKL